MATYTVQSPVKHGGKIYEIGATIKLDDETAAPLLALGRITTQGGTKNSSEAKGSADTGDAARQAAESGSPATEAGASAPATKKSGGKK